MEKLSYERRVYESVDCRSLSMSRKLTGKIILVIKGSNFLVFTFSFILFLFPNHQGYNYINSNFLSRTNKIDVTPTCVWG